MECYIVKEVTMNKDRTQGSNVKYEITDLKGVMAKGYDPNMPYQMKGDLLVMIHSCDNVEDANTLQARFERCDENDRAKGRLV